MVYLWLTLLLTAHNVIGCWKEYMQFFVCCSVKLFYEKVLACREAGAVVLCHVRALVVNIEYYY